MIAISLSPNTEKDDVLLALKLLFSPWRFFTTESIRLLEQWFRQYFNIPYAVSFNSGRSSLYAILKTIGIGESDEVVLQSFTCVAVPNSIIWTGATPVYADITPSLTMDPDSLKKKITKKTKAIIIQHTFGIPADITTIIDIAKEHKLFVIEDCAHAIGIDYKNRQLGMFGDASFFSFGRDKAFSSVFGGMVITKSRSFGKKLRVFQKHLREPGAVWTIRQIFHPLAFFFILPLYNFFSLGKIILVILQKLRFLSFPVSYKEKIGESKPTFVAKLPEPLACLALQQIRKIKEFNKHRMDISNYYLSEFKDFEFDIPYKESIPFLRFPILSENRDELLSYFKKNKIYLGTWYSNIIDPKGVDFTKIFFEKSSCSKASDYALKIINLPTHPTMTMDDAKRIVDLLKTYDKNKRS
ncbi:MAG: aminotransferase class I/II-fold pyridoxal phosphate-dependent enzyme [bacterium]|nr:aminotransferase class I/II-fold pyridoxal phosphate-dependent enzyme [bacterium]